MADTGTLVLGEAPATHANRSAVGAGMIALAFFAAAAYFVSVAISLSKHSQADYQWTFVSAPVSNIEAGCNHVPYTIWESQCGRVIHLRGRDLPVLYPEGAPGYDRVPETVQRGTELRMGVMCGLWTCRAAEVTLRTGEVLLPFAYAADAARRDARVAALAAVAGFIGGAIACGFLFLRLFVTRRGHDVFHEEAGA